MIKTVARKLYYLIPPGWRLAVRWMVFLPVDIFQNLFSSSGELKPPRRLIYTGAGDFLKTGKAFVQDFQHKNLIQPHSRILDVGSGIGRLAIPLTDFLTEGKYEGFDIMKTGVDWCSRNITRTYPQFTFRQVALSNDLYRKDGEAAGTFKFPYPDQSFDFAIVISVFTHMVPEEVQQYVSEISRVLKPGGSMYATFFILNENSRQQMNSDSNPFNFRHERGMYSLLDPKVKSANVAFDETYLVNQIILPARLAVASIAYGRWSTGRPGSSIDFQDRIVCRKIT